MFILSWAVTVNLPARLPHTEMEKLTHIGINNFTASFETLQAQDSCTSCYVTQDHSAYWTPALYFMYSNGTAVLVEQVGGMLACVVTVTDLNDHVI